MSWLFSTSPAWPLIALLAMVWVVGNLYGWWHDEIDSDSEGGRMARDMLQR